MTLTKKNLNSLLISLCILRDLPQQKIHRELCGGEDPAIFLHYHVPMERFFDGTNQKISVTGGGKGQIRKFQKDKKERMEETKRRDLFCYGHGGSHTHVFSMSWERPWATTLMQPSLRRTHLYRNLPYKIRSC
jgi:hypothetical protein